MNITYWDQDSRKTALLFYVTMVTSEQKDCALLRQFSSVWCGCRNGAAGCLLLLCWGGCTGCRWPCVGCGVLFWLFMLLGLVPRPVLVFTCIGCEPMHSQCGLRVPVSRAEPFGGRGFLSAAPLLWGSLPVGVGSLDSIVQFRRCLRTFLFSQLY